MADMTITGDARFDGVLAEMKRMENAVNSLEKRVNNVRTRTGGGGNGGGGRGAQRAGMGLLELSRGVEDFAVAGMRGVMNNIPGTIMSFGGSMGLAAVVSLTAVAFATLGKAVYDWATDADLTKARTDALTAANEKFAASINAVTNNRKRAMDENAREAAMQKAEQDRGLFMERFPSLSKQSDLQQSRIEESRAAQDRIADLRLQLAGKKGGASVDITGRAEEDLKNAQSLIARLESQQSEVERQRQRLTRFGTGGKANIETIADIEGEIAERKRTAEKSAAIIAEAQKRKSEAEAKSFGSIMMGAGGPALLAKRIQDRQEEIDNATKVLAAQKAIREEAIRQESALQQQLKDAKLKLDIDKDDEKVLRDKLKVIEDEIRAARESEDSARRKLGYTKEEAELIKQIAATNEFRATVEETGKAISEGIKQRLATMEAFAQIDSVLNNMGIGGGDMLSSAGRIGGSVAEYQSAVATINYQRETLSALRTIARNTAKKQIAAYS